MAQVGRISGPLLEANLLRKGTSNSTTQDDLKFKNTNSDTTLLKIDVTNGRVGVDLEAPAAELQISQHTHTTDLIVDNAANIANYEISSNNINVNNGNIFLNASEAIVLSNLETEQFYVSDNFILTKDTNVDIELKPHGTGRVELGNGFDLDTYGDSTLDTNPDLKVFGDIHTLGNITFDGTITFGDNINEDTISFNADVQDNIIPDTTDIVDLGTSEKRWNKIFTNLVNGQLVASGAINVDGMRLDSRQGGIFYVAKGGSNTNAGDHPNSPVLTIEEAIARCDASTTGPVTIYVYPGEYEETCPLVVPDNVTILGVDIRNVIVKPTVVTQNKDVFHLSDSSTVSNITIKDYYYDSGNNTGYAFRFAPGAVITNRSPYVQNVTVITKGSVTSASDPRGFDEGDAGRGAWIDGAELDSASIEASMLFHSATFIMPGVDAISMTNGVRVEWLNSFTYFANRGLYAFNGITGRTTYDGSTVEYGAEVRSIGSANVYGNYGAVADGADTLMYLIQHNMAYIGVGKFVDNDASRAVYANETVELNSGKIHYTTTDHLGGFRIGDNFWVDFETGNTTINIDTLEVDHFNALRINTGNDTTVIDGSFIDLGNLTISDNNLLTNTGNLNITSATGTINLQDNTSITGNLEVSGNFTFGGTLNISGNEATDSLTFNTQFDQNFNPNLHQTYNLGSFEKKWLIAHLDRVEAGDMSFYDNIVTTNVSNADLELRANGTGNIYIPVNATISNALTVIGTTTFNNNVNIVDPTFTISGTLTQPGSTTTSEDFVVGENIDVGASAQFEEILVDDNFITTTTTNADLELRASGTGIVNLQTNVNVDNNLSANDVDNTNVTVTLNTTSDNANIDNVEINDNYIETTSLNGDLTLASTRNVIVTGTDVRIVNDLTVSTDTSLQDTTITGTLAHTGAYNQTGNYTIGGELTVDNVYVEDNFITTTSGNLTLRTYDNSTDEGLILLEVELTRENPPGSGIYDQPDETSAYIVTDFENAYADIVDIEILSSTRIRLTLDNKTGTWVEGRNLRYDAPGALQPIFGKYYAANESIIELNKIIIPTNNVAIANDLDVDGVTNLDDTTINGTLTHSGNRNQTGNYEIAGELTVDNVYIEDNFITTTTGDLFLGSDQSGDIVIDTNNVAIANDLDVNGVTNLDNTTINGTLAHTGNRTQTGDYNIAGELTVDNVYVEDNFITTTSGNLILGATGDINADANDVEITQDLTVSGNTALGSETVVPSTTEILPSSITSTASFAGFEFQPGTNYGQSVSVLYIDTADWDISGETFPQYLKGTNTVNGDYFLIEIDNPAPGAPGQYVYDVITKISSSPTTVIINQSDVFDFELGTILGEAGKGPVDVSITGTLTQTGDRTQTGNLDIAGEITNGNILIEDNFISTTATNSDLELRANGTGEIVIDPTDSLTIENNLFVGGTLDYQGSLTINGDVVLLGNVQDGSLTVTENFTVSGKLDINSQAQFEDIRIEDNFITTTLSNSDLELRASGTGDVILQENVQVNNNLLADNISTGNITVNNDLVLDELVITDSNIEINDNYISTKISNADLELRANGTGVVALQENAVIEQNLTVNNTTNLLNTNITGLLTYTGNTTQTGTYNLTGDLTIGTLVTERSASFGDIRLAGNVFETSLSNSNLEFRSRFGDIIISDLNASNNLTANTLTVSNIIVTNQSAIENLELNTDIQIFDNVITTTNSNSNLELRTVDANVLLNDIVVVDNKISTIGDSTVEEQLFFEPNSSLRIDTNTALQIPVGTSEDVPLTLATFLDSENAYISESGVFIDGGDSDDPITEIYDLGESILETTTGNTGAIRFNTTDGLFEGRNTNLNRVTFGGVYSSDRLTSVTADPVSNNIRFIVNGSSNTLDSSSLVGEVTGSSLSIHNIQVEDINIDNNRIQTTNSNSDLELRADGTGILNLGTLGLSENTIKKDGVDLTIKNTGFGRTKFTGTIGIAVPFGTTNERPIANPPVGDTRWNTTTGQLETWNGTQYISAAGVAAAISRQEFDDLLLEYTLIFG